LPLDISRVRAVCFDVDGTLRNTDDQYVEKLAGILRWAKAFFPRWDERKAARRLVMWAETPFNYLFAIPDRLGMDDKLVALADFLHHRGLIRPQREFLLIEGVWEMLQRLASRYPLAVVSARSMRGTMAFLEHFGLRPLFHCVAGGQTTPFTKPHPEPIRWAARQMGVAAHECLMVGDTTVDIRAGVAAGAPTVGVLCGFGEEEELRRAGADLILPSTAALTGALKL
jgi:phosphoglycolate phosphatase-like HAD superfamily hydrolase